MPEDLCFSRLRASARRLGDLAPDRHRFPEKSVLLTGEVPVILSSNGRECLLDSLRLLIRICSNVSLAIPEGCGSLLSDCLAIAERISFGSKVTPVRGAPALSRYDAILSIGTAARADLPWTVINSHGWLARVSSGGTSLPATCGQANPVSSLAAACLGVGEVFKRLMGLKETRARLLDGMTFSLKTYQCGDAEPGPRLPRDLRADLLLAGMGAIGNGVAHLLSRLPIGGRAWIVDMQRFQEENLGTCFLIGPADLGTPKAAYGANVLGRQFRAAAFHEDIDRFRRRVGLDVPYPAIIVNGLDNSEARTRMQALWPDLVIDGAIGDFPCQVSRHRWGDDAACLKCLFRTAPGEAAEEVQSRATGLSSYRVRTVSDLVTLEDVQQAAPEKQEWLRARVGRQVCSVIQEGIAQQISQDPQPDGFQPSVPFVACMAAAMAVAELVKHAAGWPTVLETRFQFDMLSGPAFGQMLPQHPRPDCDCVTRARNIEKWRRTRASGSHAALRKSRVHLVQ